MHSITAHIAASALAACKLPFRQPAGGETPWLAFRPRFIVLYVCIQCTCDCPINPRLVRTFIHLLLRCVARPHVHMYFQLSHAHIRPALTDYKFSKGGVPVDAPIVLSGSGSGVGAAPGTRASLLTAGPPPRSINGHAVCSMSTVATASVEITAPAVVPTCSGGEELTSRYAEAVAWPSTLPAMHVYRPSSAELTCLMT